MWGSYPASLWNLGGSTQMFARAWNNAQRDTLGFPPPVKQESLRIALTVLVRRKNQPANQEGRLDMIKTDAESP